tara:strand:- start:2941 stop:3309 length:369 start_codon:yes stop_codon:yes gene_type:complete
MNLQAQSLLKGNPLFEDAISLTQELIAFESVTPDNEGRLSLIKEAETVIHQKLGVFPRGSTSGRTSDGHFFRDICPQVIEMGLPNKTIHQENEHVAAEDIAVLAELYQTLFTRLLEEQTGEG